MEKQWTQAERDAYKSPRTATWKTNHANIFDTYWTYYEENNKRPTQAEVAEKVGLSRKAVNAHMKEMDLFDGMDNHKKFRDEVINKLRKNGDASSLKLWLQVVFQWNEKRVVETVNKKEDIVKIEYKEKKKPVITELKQVK